MSKEKVIGSAGITASGNIIIADVTGQVAIGENITQIVNKDRPYLQFILKYWYRNAGVNSPYGIYVKNIGKETAIDVSFRVGINAFSPPNPFPPDIEFPISPITDDVRAERAGGVQITEIVYKDINGTPYEQDPLIATPVYC